MSKVITTAWKKIMRKFGYCDKPITFHDQNGQKHTVIQTIGVGMFLISDPETEGDVLYIWSKNEEDLLKQRTIFSANLPFLLDAVDKVTQRKATYI